MGVWMRGLVLALGVLAGCDEPSSSENSMQSRISIYSVGGGWGARHSFSIGEDDSVSEYFFMPEMIETAKGDTELRTSGVAPGAFKAIKALMKELDFDNLSELCRLAGDDEN